MMKEEKVSQLYDAPLFDRQVIAPNLIAPTIYFDDVTAAGHVGGVLQVVLETQQLSEGPGGKIVTGRNQAGCLRFSIGGLQALHRRLGELLLAAQQTAGGS